MAANARREGLDMCYVQVFGRHRRVLDLGGGTGSFLLAILSRFDVVRGTLYDLSAVTRDARRGLQSVVRRP